MKQLHQKLLVFSAVFGFALTGSATIIVNQTNWPTGGKEILKTNEDFPDSVGWQCGTGTAYGAEEGVLNVTNNAGSLTLWAYFADSNNPVTLAVGEKIRMTADLVFSGVAASNANRYLRFGLLYSGPYMLGLTNAGTIRNDNLTGYGQNMNFGVSWGLTGPLQTFADTNSVDGQGVVSKSTELDTSLGPNGGGAFGDPGFTDGTNYTLIMTVARTAASSVDITTTWLGSTLLNGGITQTVTDTNYVYTNYDTFVWRPNAAAQTSGTETFSLFKVEKLPLIPSAPQITSIKRTGPSTVVVTWNCDSGYSYSVLKTNGLSGSQSATWPAITAGYPLGGTLGTSISFTDTNASGSSSFYRISSP